MSHGKHEINRAMEARRKANEAMSRMNPAEPAKPRPEFESPVMSRIKANAAKFQPGGERYKGPAISKTENATETPVTFDSEAAPLQARRSTFPWEGEIVNTSLAALRSKPHKDIADPYEGIIADLPEGTSLVVREQENGWLRVEVKVNNQLRTGYISSELVAFTHEADNKLSQVREGDARWGNQRQVNTWHSKYRMVFNDSNKQLTIRMRLYSLNATESNKKTWSSMISMKWNNQFELVVSDKSLKNPDWYSVIFETVWVDNKSEAHHIITPTTGRTASMTTWGFDQDVPHEFGHMIGNKDEYYKVDGIDHGLPNQTGKGIMNNSSEFPFERHLEPIRLEAAKALNINERQCVIK